MVELVLLVLRIGLGLIFVGHGLQKVFAVFSGPGIKGFSGMLSSLGFSPALFWAYIAAYTELIGGLLLILGILTRTASLLIFILMIVATFKVHLFKGFFLSSGGFEYNLLIICVCIALMLLGPGKFSIFNKF
jgi:putative oxidoreductase